MKYGFVCAATIAVLSLAAVSARAQGVLLYSFEPGDSPNALDGFQNLGSNTLNNESTYGVTNGTQAMQVVCASSSFDGIISSTGTGATIPAVLNANPNAVTAISMTVTQPLGETYGGSFFLLGITLRDSDPSSPYNGDQFQVAGADEQHIETDPGNLPVTIVIPLTGTDPISFNPTTYSQLVAAGWVTTGFEIFEDHNAPLTFALDNIQAVVPEPASILSMGAISGLLVLRRRRIA